jgi:hypothetical protein
MRAEDSAERNYKSRSVPKTVLKRVVVQRHAEGARWADRALDTMQRMLRQVEQA